MNLCRWWRTHRSSERHHHDCRFARLDCRGSGWCGGCARNRRLLLEMDVDLRDDGRVAQAIRAWRPLGFGCTGPMRHAWIAVRGVSLRRCGGPLDRSGPAMTRPKGMCPAAQSGGAGAGLVLGGFRRTPAGAVRAMRRWHLNCGTVGQGCLNQPIVEWPVARTRCRACTSGSTYAGSSPAYSSERLLGAALGRHWAAGKAWSPKQGQRPTERNANGLSKLGSDGTPSVTDRTGNGQLKRAAFWKFTWVALRLRSAPPGGRQAAPVSFRSTDPV